MKVIKRDGRVVDYDKQKVEIAIQKANKEVRTVDRAEKEDIEGIISYIEELNKKRMLVEDIQDIIEEKLMQLQKYELAKKYIVYRYTRALVRKQNTTDETILGLIKNQNKEIIEKNPCKNTLLASTQRDYIAGEVSKDLTKRILLPEKISKAHEEGILYFHDAEYFLQPIFNSCFINIKDMLENKTVINGKIIETPETFQIACIIITQIILTVASSQYGKQALNIKHLGKYLRKSKERFQNELEEYKEKLTKYDIENIVKQRLEQEVKTGIEILEHQINLITTTNGQTPDITLFLELDENDEYIEENAKIIEEILKHNFKGMKNEKGEYETPEFPKLLYVLQDNNCLKGGKYDYLTKLAIDCSKKSLSPCYISEKKMKEKTYSQKEGRNFLTSFKDNDGKYKFEGRFNQGIVSINLPQIGIIANKNEDEFWKILDERLELCKEALMCRHYALLGTKTDTSPIHWKYGAIARLEDTTTIDELLKGGYSTLSLGYIGVFETTKLLKGVSHTTKTGEEFALKLIRYLKDTVDKWTKETNVGFVLYGVQEKWLGCRFARIDKQRYGNIQSITDKGYYTNSFNVDIRENIDKLSKLKFESQFQEISLTGAKSFIQIQELEEETIKYIYDNNSFVDFY